MSKKNKKMAKKQAAAALPANISWQIPEREKHERGKSWYITAGLISLGLITYAIYTHNYLFALIILMVIFIIIFLDQEDAMMLKFSLEPKGIRLGQKFYEYEVFKDFSIVFRPEDDIRNIYFNFKNNLRPHLSIPLQKTNPIIARNYLLRYLSEDLSRNDAPFSEGLGKVLKI